MIIVPDALRVGQLLAGGAVRQDRNAAGAAAVYRKLLRFDIKTEEGGAELLFDEDYDSKRAADELIKLAGGKNRTDRG